MNQILNLVYAKKFEIYTLKLSVDEFNYVDDRKKNCLYV